MAVESPPWATQAGSFNAEQTRRAVFAAYARTAANNPGIIAGGLLSTADLQLSAPVSGMSVNVSAGECIIGGSEGGAQGGYYARGTSQTNLAIAASNPTNPRIDTVCATSADAQYTIPTGGTSGQWTLQVVTGTPTSGATLSNLNGAATLPLSSLLLGYVLVPANATNIITADIANVATVAQAQLGRLVAFAQPTTSSNYTTTSSSFVQVDGTNLSLTVTCTGRPVRVTFCGNGFVSATANAAIGNAMDGAVSNSGQAIIQTSTWLPFSVMTVFSPTQGSHTFAPYYATSASTLNVSRGANSVGGANQTPTLAVEQL